jgi:hypothetical protein
LKPNKLSLKGLRALTDDVGMFQHTKFSTIDRREGYTTDDNARALIAALRYHRCFRDVESFYLAEIYLAFLLHMQKEDGSFHNILGFDRRYQDEIGSEDSMGHALWACGYTMSSDVNNNMKKVAKELFDKSLPQSRTFTSPKAKAFTILGLRFYHDAFPHDNNIMKNIELFADELVKQYHQETDINWHWFEAYLTYANARLPHALLSAYTSVKKPHYLSVAQDSFDFLIEKQIHEDIFVPIGTEGWYKKNGDKAIYDQQPLEASCMVETALLAYDITSYERYRKIAKTAFEWYHGKNTLQIVLFNPETDTCYDGLTPKGLNINQGAEATLSYYLAFLTLHEHNLL